MTTTNWLAVAVAAWVFLGGRTKVRNIPKEIDDAFHPLRNHPKYSGLTYYWQAVSKMETAMWSDPKAKAPIYNIFGMRKVAERKTTQTGATGSGFGMYSSYVSCVLDIILYMEAKQYPANFGSLADFVRYMGTRGYYGTESFDSYYPKVIAWLNK